MTEDIGVRLAELAERWRGAPASERANFPAYLIEFVDALGVDRPGPASSGHQFECPVTVVTQQGLETTNFIDLYKRDHFVLEAKDHDERRPDEILLRKAFGQAANYAINLPEG